MPNPFDPNNNKPDSPEKDNENSPSPFKRPPAPKPDSGTPKKIGIGMYIAGTLLALALLTQLFSWALESKETQDGIVVRIAQQTDGHYYANGEINGKPVVFLVDTGATSIAIPGSIADEIGLRRLDKLQVGTAAGEVTVHSTDGIRVKLGRIEMTGVEAVINPHMEGPAILLGMSFLRRTEFKQRETVLVIRQR